MRVATSEFADPISIDVIGELGSCCTALDDAIWLPGSSAEGTLLRFDVDDLEVTDTLELGSGTGGGIAAAGAISITGSGNRTVHRIDPVTMEVTDIRVLTFRSRAPAYGDGAIWIAGGGTLSRIDVDSLEVTELDVTTTPECRVDYTPAVSDGVAWIGSGSAELCRVDLATGEITRYR